ncbi:hypothetical protein V493_07637, partial [Pseudogymnoascus sp. VKM F-4281 (FW-2241)]
RSRHPQNPRHLRPPPPPTHLQRPREHAPLYPRPPPNHRAPLRKLHPKPHPRLHLPLQRAHRSRHPHRRLRRAADAPTGARDDPRPTGPPHDLHPLDNTAAHAAIP